VVGSKNKVLFGFGVSLSRTAQLRSAVPAPTATLHPKVLPLELWRIQRKFPSVRLSCRSAFASDLVIVRVYHLLLICGESHRQESGGEGDSPRDSPAAMNCHSLYLASQHYALSGIIPN
jgi:hypothetical protein